MNNTYQPDSQFLERLEWQLSSEYRRMNRLKSSPGKIAFSRRIVAAAGIVGILMTGVAIVKAADYIKNSWRKKIEIARAETQVQLKAAHFESRSEMAARIEKQFSDGLIQEEDYRAMKIAADKSALELKISRLNLDEVRISGLPPRDELYAPKVGGRDFVSERLKIEQEQVGLDLDLLKKHLERFEQLFEKNLISEHELAPIRANYTSVEVSINKIQQQLDLRKRFTTGEITALEVEIRDMMTVSEKNKREAQALIEALKTQLKRLEDLEARGMIDQSEIEHVKDALFDAETEWKLACVEIDVLKKIK